jgi:hypothetical protein
MIAIITVNIVAATVITFVLKATVVTVANNIIYSPRLLQRHHTISNNPAFDKHEVTSYYYELVITI